MLLANKVAFVTGAGSGISAAGARAMAREGAHVFVTDRNGAAAQTIAESISKEGFRADAIELDVTDDTALVRAIASVAQRTGRLDILHSHAGIQIEGKLEQVDVAEMDASWAVNVRAHFVWRTNRPWNDRVRHNQTRCFGDDSPDGGGLCQGQHSVQLTLPWVH